jgi:transcriptional regulator with XRE-family HTH domain
MKIGNRLKTLRTSKGYTPEFIAEKLGISKSTYGRYERNENVPDLNVLEEIASLYEITIAELLTDEHIIFSKDQKGGTSNNALIINQQLSEKLINQYELRIKEKDELISDLKSKLEKFSD